MLGSIAGDIIGSPYEFNNIKTCDFPLFTSRSSFTDDTVLTVAVADAIMNGVPYQDKFREYYRRYPDAGYGTLFHRWASSPFAGPYQSFGNGSAMRVSPVGYAFQTLEEVLAEAERSAAVTHDHPEGIKGAKAVAAAIFLARTGCGKEDIAEYVERSFGYDLSESLESLRGWYALDFDPMYESCQKTVPPAFIAFLESSDFEDAVRKAVSLGGDSDTLACITGGVAEAYYGGVPDQIRQMVLAVLDEDLSAVLLRFLSRYPTGS